jgi:hypothetical protein
MWLNRVWRERRRVNDRHRHHRGGVEAIKATMPLGSVGFEKEVNAKGERTIWLAPNVLDKLRAIRGPGESYSDVILPLAEERG